LIVLKTFGLFVLALLGELGGTYAIWRWLRADASALLALVG
jgi:drug/metabolite transporter superfamily protein YnfA